MKPSPLAQLRAEILERLDHIAAQTDDFLDSTGAAAFLKITVETLRNRTSDKDIPHYKVGRELRFRRSELIAYMTRHRVPTNAEIANRAVEH